jgi:RHS repeat-associated protein
MEVTDEAGGITWSGRYKAWGLAEETRSEKAIWAEIRNPLRFQGQYFDVETNLHYNRYRYYDPQVGRFISKDPIELLGGLNLYVYAHSPTVWIDPLGLAKSSTSGHSSHAKVGQSFHNDMDQYPYPSGYMRERRIGGVGRADAINVDECSIIERKCTCSTRTIKRGETQLLRYCNEMK